MPLIIRETENVGRCRCVVSYHTGKRHADGSEFFDVRIFSNRKKKDAFVRQLVDADRAMRAAS